MKHFTLLFIVIIGFTVKLFSLEHLENLDFFPGRINICFSADLVGNTEGDFEIDIVDNTVVTPFKWFNDFAKEYQIIDLKQLYRVKNREWNRNGKYPMNVFRLEIKDHERTDELLSQLKKVEHLLFAELDPIHRQSYTPNDPHLLSQWALKNIEAERAWDFETGSSDIIISIVDSGVKWNHADLAANIYINEAELPGVTINWETGQISGGDGQDNDGNGYIDDVLGWDFVEGTYENWTQDNNPFQKHPGNEHGTHVAGCAAAVGDNGIGVAGPAYNVKILVTKHSFTNQATNYIFDGYAGVYYSVDTGAHIINCSWGGRGGAEIANLAASYAKDHGSLMMAAASNDNTDNTFISYYPSDAEDGISVAATNADDTKASFSNYGTPIDVSAPGVNILATFYGQMGEDSYAGLQGTSMASPVAAGVAALIRSHYPEISVDSLIARLKIGCDPIDHLNHPRYAGKLGAGRVNAFNSLMFDRIPYIEFQELEIVEISGDDNTLNPGENLRFKLHLRNRENWLDALPFTGTISSDNPHIEIINAQSNWEMIPNGEISQSLNVFEISVSENCPIETFAEIILTFNADGGTDIVVEQQLTFSIAITGNKDGWPFETEINQVTSTIVFDITGDNNKEIIFVNSDNQLFIADHNKNILDNFPVQINTSINNPLALVKIGDEYEVIATGNNHIYKINILGEISAHYTLLGNTRSSVVSFDLNNNGHHVIATGDVRGNVYLFDHNLNLYDNYPVNLGSPIISLPVFVDFNKDGTVNLIVNTSNRKLNILNAETGVIVPNSPINTGINIISGVVAAENEQNTYLLLAGGIGDNNLKLINNFTETTAEALLHSSVSTFPIITDLNNNSELDIISVTNNGWLYLFDINLNTRPGFPIQLSGLVTQSPVVADIDNDGIFDIIVPTNDGKIYAINYEAQVLNGFPYIFDYVWRSSPVIADIDQNQTIDLIISNSSNLYYLALPFSFTESPYSMHAYNVHRNAVYSSNFTSINNHYAGILPQTSLIGNYPNPFNPETQIRFYAGKADLYEIEIFNIKGQKVNTLSKNVTVSGQNSIIWNGTDANNNMVGSGVYLYRLKNSETNNLKKMILIK